MRKFTLLVLALFFIGSLGIFAADANEVKLIRSTNDEIILKVTINQFDFQRVKTPNGEELVLVAPNTHRILTEKAPDLVKMTTSVIIPDKGKMKVSILDFDYYELDHINMAPSKGNLSRKINPRNVKFKYGKWYKKDKFFPNKLADISKPYIANDFRGQALNIYPFQFNPHTNILRVYKEITIQLKKKGNKGDNEKSRNRSVRYNKLNKHFKEVYSRHFLNYSEMEAAAPAAQAENYTTLTDPIGTYLIVCYSNFMDEMAPFVAWKQSIGYTVDLVNYSTIGSSAALKTYVANYYNTNGLNYLLLVGDHAQVPTSSTSAGDSDNNYGYIVGSDNYLDIFVGRFSAETEAQVTTQVDRTIYYERDLLSTASFFHHAIGMGSSEGPGHNNEYDYQHINYILDDLVNYGYTEHQCHQSGGSATLMSSLINNGAGTIFYCGHGTVSSWYTTSWQYTSTHVNALTNVNELPFVFSVACVVGDFRNNTCYCEVWQRATSNGNPTGSIAHAGSTINQDWQPPMTAQDEMADILVSGNRRTFGGVFVNGLFEMEDVHGTSGRNMADTWTCFGDPSVQLRTPGALSGPTSSSNNPPVANFTCDDNTVTPGTTVQFTDTSSNSPTSWSWSFPGGSPSTSSAQNPSVTYASEGTYNVTLTATNAYGNDTEVKTGYIVVSQQNITYCASAGADYSYEWIAGVNIGTMNNTSGAAGYTDFTSVTCNLEAGASTSVTLTPGFSGTTYMEYWKIWIDFNQDGDFVDSGEEVFSYNSSSTVNGSFTIPSSANGITTRMRVTMKYNSAPTSCENTFSYGEVEDYTVTISAGTVNPPVANFTASPTSILTGQSVAFTDTSTNNPTSWSWSFPGGTPSTSSAQNPTVTYNTAGTYNVTLTATNSAGSDGETKTGYITVTNQTITYCTASGNNQNYEWIAGVSVGPINNTSAGASGYSDYTSIVGNLSKGSSISVSLTPGFASTTYTEYWKIFIDYNHDGDFSDSGETVFSGSGRSVVSGSFTVPTSALSGNTRMRVVMDYNSPAEACGTFTYGEVEDYTVNIQ